MLSIMLNFFAKYQAQYAYKCYAYKIKHVMHFRHILAKIQPKNRKLVHDEFIAMLGNISIGRYPAPLGYALVFAIICLQGIVTEESNVRGEF